MIKCHEIESSFAFMLLNTRQHQSTSCASGYYDKLMAFHREGMRVKKLYNARNMKNAYGANKGYQTSLS